MDWTAAGFGRAFLLSMEAVRGAGNIFEWHEYATPVRLCTSSLQNIKQLLDTCFT
jgi:hypothetical protein